MKKSTKFWIVFGVILVIAGGIGGCSYYVINQVKNAMRTLGGERQTMVLEKRDLRYSLSASGKIVPTQTKTILSTLNGATVTEICVAVGDEVQEGDVLCIFDDADYQQNLADARQSLHSDQNNSQINVSSAERLLREAEAIRDLDAERANADVARAYSEYVRALDKQIQAEETWNQAIETRYEKEGELELRRKLLEEAGEAPAPVQGMEEIAAKFINTLGELTALSGAGITLQNIDEIGIGNTYWESMPASHFIAAVSGITQEDAEVQVAGKLAELKAYRSAYSTGISTEMSEASGNLSRAQSEVSAWEAKVSSAKAEESSAKAAYEAAVQAADAALQAYNNQLRQQQDSARNDKSSVAGREESLASSRTAQSVSGISVKQQIRNYEKQISLCTVTAPIAGRITSVGIENGDVYSGGAIVTIEDDSEYMISAEISEYDILKVEVGQKVIIRTKGTGDTSFDGRIVEIAPKATAQSVGSNDVTYNVKISFNPGATKLKLDMTCILEIILDETADVFAVPIEAVNTDENGGNYIVVGDTIPEEEAREQKDMQGIFFQTEEDGTITLLKKRRIYVECGIETDYYVAVEGEGLEEGLIVLSEQDTEGTLSAAAAAEAQGAMGGF